MLKAYHILVGNLPNHRIFLLIVGDGPLRPKLEHYAKKHNLSNVILVGFKNQTELPKYYVMADIFVLPSVSETWGLVVNEAMCFKLPVIVSDLVSCGKDLVKIGENGYIFSVGNINKLANCIKDLIIHPQKRNRFGENSFKIVKRYNFERPIRSIIDCLKFLSYDL